LTFLVGSGTDFRLEAPVDALFSNAALHWMKPPEAAVQRISEALRAGGRFVAQCGGHGNVASIRDALRSALEAAGFPEQARRDPWYFPTIGEYAAILEVNGLLPRLAARIEMPT